MSATSHSRPLPAGRIAYPVFTPASLAIAVAAAGLGLVTVLGSLRHLDAL